MSIKDNVVNIQNNIYQAAISSGKDPNQITLCAATKMNSADNIRQAIAAGITCCGENRVQELTEKLAQNAYEGAQVHFIGHLQTNKVKYVVGKVDLIQSVDSERLLSAINKEAEKQGIVQEILLELNLSGEASKSGFSRCELFAILPNIKYYTHVQVAGFMTIPPICHNSGENDKFFQEMYNLSVDITAKKYDNVRVDVLSMGMSSDYREAIAHGSTMIRVGTAIFGARNYQ